VSFVGDSEQVENGIGRAAGGGDACDGILDGGFGDDFGGRDIAAEKIQKKRAFMAQSIFPAAPGRGCRGGVRRIMFHSPLCLSPKINESD